MHLQQLFVKLPAAFLTAATVPLPDLVLHAQDLLSVVTVEVITLVSPFHPVRRHIDAHRAYLDTLAELHTPVTFQGRYHIHPSVVP